MPTWFALAVLVAAVALTYVCCIRPMRRGKCGAAGGTADRTEDAARQDELAQLRADRSS